MVLKKATDSNSKTAPPPQTTGIPNPADVHLWERTGNGDIWKGFFISAEVALNWVREHPGNFVINNVPPSTSHRFITGTADAEKRPTPWKPGTGSKPQRTQPPQRAPQRPVVRQPVQTTRYVPQRAETAAVAAEQAALKESATKRLGKHKADEAADLKKGKNK